MRFAETVNKDVCASLESTLKSLLLIHENEKNYGRSIDRTAHVHVEIPSNHKDADKMAPRGQKRCVCRGTISVCIGSYRRELILCAHLRRHVLDW